ncbi:MAG: ATP-binding protein, partial [Deltaproteobacteria bacterium]|nr:ATP-binding protein [Deltaproteobacteria bacterium]
RRFASPADDAEPVLRHAVERLGLSARAYTRALKVARTIADLAGSERVLREHVLEALQFRTTVRSLGGTA